MTTLMMMLHWSLLPLYWLLLSTTVLANKGYDFRPYFHRSKLFLRHNDLYVPLNPLVWGQMKGQQRMLLAVQYKGKPDVGMGSALEKLYSNSYYFVDRRGLLKFDDQLVDDLPTEKLQVDDQAGLLATYDKLIRQLGAVNGFDKPFEQLVMLPGISQEDLTLAPTAYWKSLSRTQFDEIAKIAGLARVLNRLHTLGLDDLSDGMIWRQNSQDPSPLISVFEVPGAVCLAELSKDLYKRFGRKLVSSFGLIELFNELDAQNLRVLAELYGDYEPASGKPLDLGRLQTTWGVMFKDCPVLSSNIPGLYAMRPNLIPAISDLNISGRKRLEILMLEICGVSFQDINSGERFYSLTKKYTKWLGNGKENDLAVLEFLSKIKGQGIDVSDAPWDITNWTAKHWKAVSRLPTNCPEYLELIVVGFLLGEVTSRLPDLAPGVPRTYEWRLFTGSRNLPEKLEKRFLREHISKLARGLLWVLDADPVGTLFPEPLLQAIRECAEVEDSVKTAIIAHAYQKTGRLHTANSTVPSLKTISPDSVFTQLPLNYLKLYLAASQPDSISILLPGHRQRLLDQAKSSQSDPISTKVLLEICELVLSDNYDPDDLELLVALLEYGWERVDQDMLERIQRKLLLIDATEVGRIPQPSAMSRMALLVGRRKGKNGSELTLDELAQTFPSLFNSAQFPVLDIVHGQISTLSASELIDLFVWQTSDIPNIDYQLACAPLLQILSYLYSDRAWSDEVMKSVGWVLSGLSEANLINLLGRIDTSQEKFLSDLINRIREAGYDIDMNNGGIIVLDPLRGVLEQQQNQAGLQHLLLSHEKSKEARLGLFPLDPAPILERIFQLGSGDLRVIQQLWEQAMALTKSYELAFKLLMLSQSFKNIPMRILLQALMSKQGSIGAAATEVKNTIVNP